MELLYQFLVHFLAFWHLFLSFKEVVDDQLFLVELDVVDILLIQVQILQEIVFYVSFYVDRCYFGTFSLGEVRFQANSFK